MHDMSSSCKQPSAVFWAVVVVVLAVMGYPLSFGPTCWLCENGVIPQRTAWLLFRPCTWLCVNGPRPVATLIRGYAAVCGDHERIELVVKQTEPVVQRYCTHNISLTVLRMPGSRSPIDYERALDDGKR